MDRENATVIANREEAIPVVVFPENTETRPRKHARSSSHPPRPVTPENSSARDKLRSLHAHASAKVRGKLDSGETSKTESPKTVQDRLLNLLLQQVIPSDSESDPNGTGKAAPKRVERPNFSIPTMSANFRRFNARIGIAFVFQMNLTHLFAWKYPTQTLSFLAIYTFTCLDPTMLAIIPVALLLYFVMVPSFDARHPPPPSLPATNLYPLSGPPLAPASSIKPAPELSRDFFRNMRDLQNSMEDFSRLHDYIVANIAPLTNFSDETISSALFMALFTSCILLFLIAHLVPWRAVLLIGGWAATLAGHPTIAALLDTEANQQMLSKQESSMRRQALAFAQSDISLDPSPEKREVEIFELQYRPLYYSESDEWEPVVFSPAPYTPLSPARISGDRPKGCRFFENVAAPLGWAWADKKWSLDLAAKEWVEERLITGVEVEVDGGRWVVDVAEREGGGWRQGEWRRRRWVRVVERVPFEMNSKEKERRKESHD